MNEARVSIWIPVLWGAMTAGAIRLLCCCCGCFAIVPAAIAGAIVAAAVLVTQARKVGASVDSSHGLLAGASVGIACGMVGTLLQLAVSSAVLRPEFMEQMSRNLPAEGPFNDWFRRSLEQQASASFLMLLLQTLLIEFGAAIVMGGVAGLLTLLVMRSSQPPQPPTPPPAPMPPPPPPSPPGFSSGPYPGTGADPI